MKLVWAGPIDNTGYGVANRRIIRAIDRYTDIDLYIKDLSGVPKSKRIIPQEEQEWLDTMYAKHATVNDAIFVSQSVPENFPVNAGLNLIGCTTFETSGLSRMRVEFCNKVSRLFVPCHFNVKTFQSAGVKVPISVVPHVVLPPPMVDPWRPEGAKGFTFLYVADNTIRKGWDILIKAYTREFSERDDVTLILKMSMWDGRITPATIVELIRREREQAKQFPQIIIMTNLLEDNEIWSLITGCDCFVLPSRGEGWGLTMSDAMAAGRPTIGTNWSGNLEYMNNENSFLIDVEKLVPAPTMLQNSGYGAGQLLAEPSCVSLQKIMRHVYTDKEDAKRKGDKAREIVETFGARAVAETVLKELTNG